ncbi:hypothetical protein ABZ371_14910 [Streptomyces sp. NPDC005899]|uniref:hypothetical protein n=1 Tax=Streptomyces sp. NPDC005899 TaxID=3155716 RepID=UPI00340343F7
MTSSQKPPLPRRTPRAGAAVPRPGNAATAKVREAVDARDALAAALRGAGIQLPAMDIRTPWPDTEGGEGGRVARYALVHLGVCSAPVAHALAAVIRNGVAGAR